MKKIILIACSLPLLSACLPSMPELPDLPNFKDVSIPTPYRPDVNQGSVLSRFEVNQLELNMSKAQVRELIGSPSVIDPFDNNRWNYINHSTLHKKQDIRYRLILTFEGDTLIDIDTSGIASLPPLTAEEKILGR